jgi:hypothetical protein
VGGPQHVNIAIIWLIRSGIGTMFFCLGGGLALRTYFRERRTWMDAQHARELERLRQVAQATSPRCSASTKSCSSRRRTNTYVSLHSINSFAMLARLASETPPPLWQVFGSVAAGLAGACIAVWFAAKVFKIGLLMHGKPPNFAALVRWARMA